MNSDKIPKKILLIRDCTFILPNDFNGTIEDAFKEFLKYREENIQSATYVSDTGLFSTFDLILYANYDKRVYG